MLRLYYSDYNQRMLSFTLIHDLIFLQMCQKMKNYTPTGLPNNVFLI